MKRKHLFASAVMAAVLAGCSQEEIIVNDNLQSLGERPMVEAPVFSFDGAESRMTTSGNYANVKWQEGDGFGAAVMDSYNAGGTTWATMFPIQKYLSSNVLFKTEDGKNFFADASMPMGNHLFYAPFNVNNISRGPLAVQLPLEQVVVPNADGSHSNTAITAFYEDKSSPVFVAYDSISATPKTTLNELQMRHIYSLPMITLELGKVQLLDAEGKLKTDGAPGFNPIYETELTIDSIVFNGDLVSANNTIVTSGNIDNDKIVAKLEKAVDPLTGKEIPSVVKWDATQFESNATSDLLIDVEPAKQVREKIVVKFEGGQKIAAGKSGKFVMVLPGAAYTKENLKVLVYAKINGKAYVSATSSLAFDSQTYVKPDRDATLLPGNAYSADEYNANGLPKDSKGTSMTYTIGGKLNDKDSEAIGFIPVDKAVISGYTTISSNSDLENFVKNVAYRGEELIQLTKEEAEFRIVNREKVGELVEGKLVKKIDPKKHFVVTATAEAPVVLATAFENVFKNACVVAGKDAFITFLGDEFNKGEEKCIKNVVLGDITWTSNTSKYFKFATGNVYANGNVTLKAAPVANYVLPLATANVTLDASMTETVKVSNMYNGIINLNSALAHGINNDYGTLNVNATTAAAISNGITENMYNQGWRAYIHEALDMDSYTDYESSMTIADGVTLTATAKNRQTGAATIGEVIATIANDGEMKTTAAAADLTISGAGEVDNTANARIDNTGNTVYAYVNNFDLTGRYDALAALNKLVVNGTITNKHTDFNSNVIETIDFINGNGINLAGYIDGATLDLTGVKTINIKANTTWVGRDASKSFVKVDNGAIVEAANCTLTIKNLAVDGYNKLAANATTSDIKTLITAAGANNVTIALSSNVSGDGLVLNGGNEVVLDLNGKTLDVSGNAVGSPGTETIGMQLNQGTTVIIKNGTIKATSDKVKMLIQNYSDLTLENVTLVGNANMNYVLSNNCGKVDIIGSTSITAATGKFAFDVCVTDYYADGTQVTVNTTGTITGNVEYGIWHAIPSPVKSTLTVTNGTIVGNLVVAAGLESEAATKIDVAPAAKITGTGWN